LRGLQKKDLTSSKLKKSPFENRIPLSGYEITHHLLLIPSIHLKTVAQREFDIRLRLTVSQFWKKVMGNSPREE
jgi:hypothetical protein